MSQYYGGGGNSNNNRSYKQNQGGWEPPYNSSQGGGYQGYGAGQSSQQNQPEWGGQQQQQHRPPQQQRPPQQDRGHSFTQQRPGDFGGSFGPDFDPRQTEPVGAGGRGGPPNMDGGHNQGARSNSFSMGVSYSSGPRGGRQPQGAGQGGQMNQPDNNFGFNDGGVPDKRSNTVFKSSISDEAFADVTRKLDAMKTQLQKLNQNFSSYIMSTEKMQSFNQSFSGTTHSLFTNQNHYYHHEKNKIAQTHHELGKHYAEHIKQLRSMFESFRQWATKVTIASNKLQARNKVHQELLHYQSKLQKLNAIDRSNDPNGIDHKINRNNEKMERAVQNFEYLNKETYTLIQELVKDKQKHLNPIVSRFMKLNLAFYKRAGQTMQTLKVLDPDGKKNATTYDQKADPLLAKLDVLDDIEPQPLPSNHQPIAASESYANSGYQPQTNMGYGNDSCNSAYENYDANAYDYGQGSRSGYEQNQDYGASSSSYQHQNEQRSNSFNAGSQNPYGGGANDNADPYSVDPYENKGFQDHSRIANENRSGDAPSFDPFAPSENNASSSHINPYNQGGKNGGNEPQQPEQPSNASNLDDLFSNLNFGNQPAAPQQQQQQTTSSNDLLDLLSGGGGSGSGNNSGSGQNNYGQSQEKELDFGPFGGAQQQQPQQPSRGSVGGFQPDPFGSGFDQKQPNQPYNANQNFSGYNQGQQQQQQQQQNDPFANLGVGNLDWNSGSANANPSNVVKSKNNPFL